MYTQAFTDKCSRNGGLVTYVANSVTMLNCLTYNTYKTWEGLCLEIVDDSKKHIKICNIYRPQKIIITTQLLILS